jgi:hypothetical protein
VQFISCATDCVCKEEDISLQPRYLLYRVLETDPGARHLESMFMGKDGLQKQLIDGNK